MRLSGTNTIFGLVIVLSGLLVIWISLAQVDEVIRVQGVIEPSAKIRSVQTRRSGEVEKVFVSIGDSVEQQQTLAVLNDTEAQASESKNRLSIESLEIELRRLEAEVTSEYDWYKDFPNTNADPKVVDTQIEMFNSRARALDAKVATLVRELSSIEAEKSEAKLEIVGLGKLIQLREEEIGLIQPMVDVGAEPRISMIRLKQRLQEELLRREQLEAKTRLLESRAAKIEQQAIEIRAAFLAEVQKDIASARAELAQRREEQKAYTQNLQEMTIKSPVAGLVSKILVDGEGDILAPGDTLFEIVPVDATRFLVKGRIEPRFLANLSKGDEASVALTNYDFTEHGTLSAQVEKIASNSTTNEAGETFYEVWLGGAVTELSKSKIVPTVTPGMIVEATIAGKTRSILEYILKPVTEISTRALTEQ